MYGKRPKQGQRKSGRIITIGIVRVIRIVGIAWRPWQFGRHERFERKWLALGLAVRQL